MQSDPDEALDVLYRLRDYRDQRSGGDARTILVAIESLIAEYEVAREA